MTAAGLLEDLLEVNIDTRKTAVIDKELKRLQMDIVKTPRRKGLHFLMARNWPPKRTWCRLRHKKNSLLGSIAPVQRVWENLKYPAAVICWTSQPDQRIRPILTSSSDTKDKFRSYCDIPHQEQLFILGDVNARVGTDRDSWPSSVIMASRGWTRMGNGFSSSVVSMACALQTASLEQNHSTEYLEGTRPSSKSKYWHQLGLILTRRTGWTESSTTRSYQSADCFAVYARGETPNRCQQHSPLWAGRELP